MAPLRFVVAHENAVSETEAAVEASGCASVEEYLASCQAKSVVFSDSPRFWRTVKGPVPDIGCENWRGDGLFFSPRRLRASGEFARCVRKVGNIPSCTTFVCYDVMWASAEELSALCHAITSPASNIHSLHLHRFFLHTDTHITDTNLKSQIEEALLNRRSFNALSVDLALCTESTILTLCKRNPCAIKSLSLDFVRYTPSTDHSSVSAPFLVDHNSNPQIPVALLDDLANNSLPLTSLSLIFSQNQFVYPNRLESLCAILHSNTTLTFLGINGLYTDRTTFSRLLNSLERNPSLRALSLAHCCCRDDADWPQLAVMLDSLQGNGLVHELDLLGTRLHGSEIVAQQLQQNLENVRHVDVLRTEGVHQVPPTTIRLFLFGCAYSGKTTLSQSLSFYFSGKKSGFFGSVRHFVKTHMLRRTRGIEITKLENNGKKISLWDMAGQREYLSFHDHMFPNFSNRATPSLFLFLWNPIEVDEDGKDKKDQKQFKTKSPEKFRNDFKYWLKFISSKTLRSESYKPKILVALTRADYGLRDLRCMLENTITQLQQEFAGLVQIDMQGVFEIDARDPLSVANLGFHIIRCAEVLLEAVPLVYQACDHAKTMLNSLVNSKRVAPLVMKKEFDFLCHKHLGIDSKEMREAIALCLNDSGDLIYLTSLELVVMDVPWFCHQIMGSLLHDQSNIHSRFEGHEPRGFYPVKLLEDFLEAELNSNNASVWTRLMKRQSDETNLLPKVEGKDLVKLLIGLLLACPRDFDQENSLIFIPYSVSSISRRKILPRSYIQTKDFKSYMGRRLTCEDSNCTFLTPGIFPLLQVRDRERERDMKRNVNV